MGVFIDAARIRAAVKSLSRSDVNGSAFFCYLILRRHMVMNGGERDALPIKGSALKDAAAEAALVDGNSVDSAGFTPFESEYRTRKWVVSNGPSDAIKNWSTRSTVVERVMDAKELTVTVAPFDDDAIRKLLKLKDAGRPDIVDTAIWWYRDKDVEGILDSSGSLTAKALSDRFTHDLGLTAPESSLLFADPSAYDDEDVIHTTTAPALPTDYLPSATRKRPRIDGVYRLKDYTAGSCRQLIDAANASGFIFSDEQIATYLTAVRTKPFVILAGVSGTGKTRLPITLAECTGSDYLVCPVRPDWTDSSPLLGYTDIQNVFHPGVLLEYARKAMDDPDREHFFILDEMNLAHVEYYFSDVLSKMETMRPDPVTGKLVSDPLLPDVPGGDGIAIPSNLCIVGSINMDESTQPISKKVLDRAFVLDFNEVDLGVVREPRSTDIPVLRWPADEWGADRRPLFGTIGLDEKTFSIVANKLTEINSVMKLGGFNFGYRLRNEICAFISNARNIDAVFGEGDLSSGAFDIALKTKALSRIEGHGPVVAEVIRGLRDCLTKNDDGETVADSKTGFQRTLNKLSDMADMFERTGYTSYWG